MNFGAELVRDTIMKSWLHTERERNKYTMCIYKQADINIFPSSICWGNLKAMTARSSKHTKSPDAGF